jgi:4-hydroxy-tetrahydrodipicolinate synthase
MNTLKKLQGIIPPMVTPLLDRDTLDTEGLERLIEHIIAGGVHGLFLLGTTGEAPSLSYKLRYELIEKATARINSRVPVLVGISDTSFTESINVAKKAADCGADAVVLAPPYYFTAGQPELIEYVEHLCDELPLPMYLYNMPGCTKINLEPKTIVELSRLEKIIGLKDSSGNLTYFNTVKTLLAGREDFSLLVGPEELLAQSVLLGADGGVNGGANLFPTLYVELYNASVAGDLAKVRELHAKVMGISTTIYRVGQYGSSFMKGVKCALKIKGICSDYMEEPFHRFRPAEAEKIRQFLEKEFGGQ